MELREAAANQKLLNAETRMRRVGLGEGQGLQLDDFGSSRQRIRDRPHEAERLRAGQQESAWALALPIHRHLQMAEKAGGILHFVHDERRRMAGEKRLGVAFRLLRLARQVQSDIGVIWEQPAH